MLIWYVAAEDFRRQTSLRRCSWVCVVQCQFVAKCARSSYAVLRAVCVCTAMCDCASIFTVSPRAAADVTIDAAIETWNWQLRMRVSTPAAATINLSRSRSKVVSECFFSMNLLKYAYNLNTLTCKRQDYCSVDGEKMSGRAEELICKLDSDS